MKLMTVPQGAFNLQRYPYQVNSTLQAWDAADEYLLAHLAGGPDPIGNLLIVNDGFGALGVALAGHGPTWMTDSHLSRLSLGKNLLTKGLDPESVHVIDSLTSPTGPFDTVLVKVPKTLALLEDELHRIRGSLRAGTRVVGAGMTRHVHASTLGLFEKLVGPTTTSLAKKKARLIHARVDPDLQPGPPPGPTRFTIPDGIEVVGHANVFSRGRLDRGTALLLQHRPKTHGSVRIADLGCGNGILGTVAARDNPEAELVFADESHHAVESARATFQQEFGPDRGAEFHVTDVLEGIPDGSLDIVLNNPPFHDRHARGDAIAWAMFNDARRALAPGGELWVVGNRHLDYHVKLSRIFRRCTVVSRDPKFVVLRATG